MSNKTFNIILNGVGGQGIITLINLIDQAAFIEGYQVRSSELHGLSQRGGSVEAHVRFGKEVLSPLTENGKADLIIATEMFEGLRESLKAGKDTKLLINKTLMHFDGILEKEKIEEILGAFKDNLHLISASDICKEKLQNEVVSGIFLLGYAVNKKLMPIKENSILEAIKTVIPAKYQELNIKAFQLSNGY